MAERSEPFPGTIEQKAVKPAGLLPKKTQQLVILGVAVVMILVMWLTGGTKRPKTTSAVSPVTHAQPPNAAAVEDFKQTLQQQQAAARQPISQANLRHLEALGLAGDVPANLPPAPPVGSAEVPEAGGVIGGTPSQAPPPDPIQEDHKKREYLSLFAPNVAFTVRKEDHTAPVAAEPHLLPEPPATVPAPSVPTPIPDARRSPDTRTASLFNASTGMRYVVFEGTIIETLLINRLNGTFSGPVNCLVTNDLYSHDRQRVLIPAGSKILGEAKKVDAFGQQRLAVFFHRLIMPDGYSVNLDQFKGLNQSGETALRDKVNNHYLQIFGVSLAIGILGGIAEAGTGNDLTNSPWDRARGGLGASLATSATNILDRFLNILPTVTIREGSRVKVYLSGDLLLPDYAQHTMKTELGVEEKQ
jgi:type IV secretion system protein VirB10